eukprot:CAMPEP_0115543736 /NCGR_PEP_ID=MMETSP0271-20121206/91717_1 /TAXON_ID=71861 /ORGANISM="Scrippsiella trochoidea, Strain CCMP3099" /LENGTH=58 /DNA_ID=CAMNT_0002977011 /DNA_START=46 /DNA_END=219 /DNA_ORIENTATION=-
MTPWTLVLKIALLLNAGLAAKFESDGKASEAECRAQSISNLSIAKHFTRRTKSLCNAD